MSLAKRVFPIVLVVALVTGAQSPSGAQISVIDNGPMPSAGPYEPSNQSSQGAPPCDPAECRRLHYQQQHLDPQEENSVDAAYEDSSTSGAAVPCYNNSKGDYYIVNVYAWLTPFTDKNGAARGFGNRYSTSVPAIQDKLKRADYILDESASNYDQHFRHLCNSSGVPDIWQVQVDPCFAEGCDSLDTLDVRMSGVRKDASGNEIGPHRNRNYIYLYWLDSTTSWTSNFSCHGGTGLCPDGNSVSSADAVRQPIVKDAAKWKGRTFVHEVIHALDAVNFTSPSGAGSHCADGYHAAHATSTTHNHHDVMCYNDGGDGYFSKRKETCAPQPSWLVDCNKDDYWKPTGGALIPAADGSLTIFNTARSIWLSGLCSESVSQTPLDCQVLDGRTN